MTKNGQARARLEPQSLRRADEFVAAVRRSRRLHGKFATPPATPEAYRRYVEQAQDGRRACFFVVNADDDTLAGVMNIGEIVRGAFQSAFVGYYAFVPNAGKGYMRAGLQLVLDYAFAELALHRIEANIQPDNVKSSRLVSGLGFRREGLSPKYLKVAGRWRDHERWAILGEEWARFRRGLV
jgi:ribosomal-protein-alanine N-acetyltransferase